MKAPWVFPFSVSKAEATTPDFVISISEANSDTGIVAPRLMSSCLDAAQSLQRVCSLRDLQNGFISASEHRQEPETVDCPC